MNKKYNTEEERKQADKERKKLWYQANKLKNNEKLRIYGLNYYKINKDIVKAKAKEFYKNNTTKVKLRNKKWVDANQIKAKESIKQRNKKWRENNPEKLREIANKRYKNDTTYRLRVTTRNLVRSSLRRKGYNKNCKTEQILGISFNEFKLYLESLWEPWMNWDNKGLYNGELNYGWDVDHIVPVSTAKTKEDVIMLNRYTNLQPLCSKINRDIKKHY